MSCRISPGTAVGDIEMLSLLGWPVCNNPALYQRAATMAVDLKHHFFDTLYHAVALEAGATLITTDQHYWRKAKNIGHMTLHGDFDCP